jgi:coenzyme F420 hydrogenase subunit beta
VAICPVNVIGIEDGEPKLQGECIACGMCYNNCPRVGLDEKKIEEEFFGRSRNDEEQQIGVYINAYAVRALQDKVKEKSQDGGAVTAILTQFLDGEKKAAVVAINDPDAPWKPIPYVAENEEEILKGAGTKYTSSPTMLGVEEAVVEGKKSDVAVVGTPCQIRAIRKIESNRQGLLGRADYLAIGLFCMETFNQVDFYKYLEDNEIDVSKVTKFEIKSGQFIVHKGEEIVHKTKLGNLKELVRPCCEFCTDFSSEFSDLSVGNVGSPDGWSTVLVRSEKGEEALKSAEKSGLIEMKPLDEVKPGMSLVTRLAKIKKKASKN